jgi:hypothetical protein
LESSRLIEQVSSVALPTGFQGERVHFFGQRVFVLSASNFVVFSFAEDEVQIMFGKSDFSVKSNRKKDVPQRTLRKVLVQDEMSRAQLLGMVPIPSKNWMVFLSRNDSSPQFHLLDLSILPFQTQVVPVSDEFAEETGLFGLFFLFTAFFSPVSSHLFVFFFHFFPKSLNLLLLFKHSTKALFFTLEEEIQ